MLRFRILIPILSELALLSHAQEFSPTFHNDNQRTGRTMNLGPSVPRLRWSLRTLAPIEASPLIAQDGTLYVASTDGRLYSLTSAGDLRWTFEADEGVFGTPAIAPDGSIILADLPGRIYCVGSDGSLRWSYVIDDGPSERRVTAPTLVLPTGQALSAGWNDRIYFLGPDGKLVWQLNLDGAGQISAAPSTDWAGNIYVAAHDTANKNRLAVWKLDPAAGAQVWKFSEDMGIDRNRIISSPAIDSDRGQLYVGVARTDDGVLYAVSLAGGTRVFRTVLPKGVLSSPALGRDGTVYVGCMDGSLYAVDPSSGSVYWRFDTGAHYVTGSPMVDGAGNIFFGDSEGYIHALSPAGHELWLLSTRSCISSAPAIGADGTLYVTSQDSTVYAYAQRRRQSCRP